jgi:hypothetical protein
MTQNDIIEMARQAGFHEHDFPFKKFKFEAFAKLVEAKASAKEREACAKVCESIEGISQGGDDPAPYVYYEAIRARGEQQ